MLRCPPSVSAIALFATLAFASLPASVSAQITDAAALDAALSAASAGDVVVFGGHIVGDFLVPGGVTLRGADEAVLEGSGVGTALTVTPGGGTPTTLDHFKIVTDGRYGIWVSGAGATNIEDVMISATRGVGIGAEDTDALALTDVRLTGPITGDNEATVPADASPYDWPTHGIILLAVDDAALDGVTSTGFAQAGAIIAGSTTAVWSSRFDRNVGTGLVIAGGDTTLDDVTASGTFRGARAIDERAAGIAIGGDANVTSTRTRVIQNDGFGLFHDGSGIVDHAQLAALSNEEGGIWTQNAEYVGLESAAVSGNKSTGIVAIDTTYTMLSDVHVIGTSPASVGGGPALADGIDLIATDATVDGAELRANDRIGLLAALGPSQATFDIALSDVLVAGRSYSLGVIFQRGDSLIKDGSSSDGVTKLGTVARNDGLLEGVLALVGITEPPSALPSAIDLVGITEPPSALPAIDQVIFGDLLITDGPF